MGTAKNKGFVSTSSFCFLLVHCPICFVCLFAGIVTTVMEYSAYQWDRVSLSTPHTQAHTHTKDLVKQQFNSII